jgi:two-component system, OmpR family, alkaline phosphatase synthesis response regulator PhoP
MKKILCIDDSVNLLQILKKRFELEIPDLKVFSANSGASGLEIARSEMPDLIILDITMPTMDGYEVLNVLKRSKEGRPATADIPVIILTSHEPSESSKYLSAGAAAYISSPFDTNELITRVKSLLYR